MDALELNLPLAKLLALRSTGRIRATRAAEERGLDARVGNRAAQAHQLSDR
jgi:hypothetical protein